MALVGQARLQDAVATIERVRSAVGAHEREFLMLDALQLILTMTCISLHAERPRAVARLRAAVRAASPEAGETRGAAMLLAGIDAVGGADSSAVRAAVEQAWGAGALLDVLGPEHIFCLYAGVALALARQLGAMDALATQIAERAAAAGSMTGAWHAWMLRALAREGMGRLADAEADIELTMQISVPASLNNAQDLALALQARICIERGELPVARARLARVDAETDNFLTRVVYLSTAASLARAAGARTAERTTLRRIQALAGDGEFGTWCMGCWPADLAVALGPCDEARDWAAHALRGARSRGVTAEIGVALRAMALVGGERPDIDGLRTAATQLEGSEMALEHARTLVELGAALRRRGHRSEARQPLAAGLDRAVRCGATALAQRARTELQATGARPRRLLITGRDALTPSERRVATLAAEGRSNREIAQDLFVTTRTVETHLSHTYRKLDITTRTQLATALARS
jgi:DNA-binding CsgD family transcriptional regulator